MPRYSKEAKKRIKAVLQKHFDDGGNAEDGAKLLNSLNIKTSTGKDWNKENVDMFKSRNKIKPKRKEKAVNQAELTALDIQPDYQRLHDQAEKDKVLLKKQLKQANEAIDQKEGELIALKAELSAEKQITIDAPAKEAPSLSEIKAVIAELISPLAQSIADIRADIQNLETEVNTLKPSAQFKYRQNPKYVCGWNIQKSGKWYKAYRVINGKKRGVHIGADLDRVAEKIISAIERNASNWNIAETEVNTLIAECQEAHKQFNPDSPASAMDSAENVPDNVDEGAEPDKEDTAKRKLSESRQAKMEAKAAKEVFIKEAPDKLANELKDILAACDYKADGIDDAGRVYFTGPNDDRLFFDIEDHKITVSHTRKHADSADGRYQAVITDTASFNQRVNEIRAALIEDAIFKTISLKGNDFICLDKLGKILEEKGFTLSEFHAALGRIQSSYRGQLSKGNPDLYESPETLKKYSYTDKKGERYLILKPDFRWLKK